ncbi:imelysin family protein [Halocola ammonii]
MMKTTKFIAALFAISLLFIGCDREDDDTEQMVETSETMRHMGEAIIAPAYAEWNLSSSGLHNAALSFTDTPEQQTLSDLRVALKENWIDWQYCSPFEFGPAYTLELRANTNTFPADVEDIQLRIEADDNPQSADERGYPSIDFLINGVAESDQEIIDLFTSDGLAGKRKSYLLKLTQKIRDNAISVSSEWNNGYIDDFAQNTGTQAGSALSLLVNELNKDYEMIKRERIALPLGLLTLGMPLPDRCEAYYGGYSAELAHEHMLAIVETYKGGDGRGLDDLLNDAEAFHQPSNQLLDEAIQEQMNSGLAQLEGLPDPLSATIEQEPATVEECYDELQALVVLLKTDMPSALGVSITFTDNDGD